MLECGQQGNDDVNATVRLLKASLKAARQCQEVEELPLAHKVLERTADLKEHLTSIASRSTIPKEQVGVIIQLEVDYFLGRIDLVSRINIVQHSN